MNKTLLISILAVSTFTNSTISQNTYDFNLVETKIEELLAEKQIPSIAIAVTKNGKTIYENAFGYADIEGKIPATVHTAYQTASVSKTFTATGIMVLQHQNKLNITDTAQNYMGNLNFQSANGQNDDVTIKHLLHHTSGLGTYFDIAYADENLPQDSFENAFKKYGRLFQEPGIISEYSNMGYGLLDHIISEVSGQSFGSFMQEEIFVPLKMEHSFVQGHKPIATQFQIAKKYDALLTELPELTNNTKGAGNIYVNIHDLAQFALFNLNKNAKNNILNTSELRQMHNSKDATALYHYYEDTFYGLGWYQKPDDNGYKIVWHEGGMMGASSIIKLIPDEDVSISVLINNSNRAACNEIAAALSKVVIPEYDPTLLNESVEITAYKPFVTDASYLGNWKGTIQVDDIKIPIELTFNEDGTILASYIDFTYRSYFTQNNPLPIKAYFLIGMVNQHSFIGMLPGTLPSKNIRQEFSQFLSFKLVKKGNILNGTVVALAAAPREYYAYPFAIQLEKVEDE